MKINTEGKMKMVKDTTEQNQESFAMSVVNELNCIVEKLERVNFDSLDSIQLTATIYQTKKIQNALEEVRDFRLLNMAYTNKQ